MPRVKKSHTAKRKYNSNRQQTRLEQSGGAADAATSDDQGICNMDINRALLGNPPIEHKSGRNFAKEAGSFGSVNAEFKRQFKGSITGNPGKPPAMPDGCTIL